MNWREEAPLMKDDDRYTRVFYSTYYTSFNIVDIIKSYIKKFQYKPKH